MPTPSRHASPPPAAHLGWDARFTRLAREVSPRVMRLLVPLGRECVARGINARIYHELADEGPSTTLQAFSEQRIGRVTFRLLDGWAAYGQPAARLDVQLYDEAHHLELGQGLARASEALTDDAEELWAAAGDWVDAQALGWAWVRLLVGPRAR